MSQNWRRAEGAPQATGSHPSAELPDRVWRPAQKREKDDATPPAPPKPRATESAQPSLVGRHRFGPERLQYFAQLLRDNMETSAASQPLFEEASDPLAREAP